MSIIGIILTILGGIYLGFTIYWYVRISQIKKWPSVSGTVQASSYDDTAFASQPVQINYKFVVNNQPYSNNQVSYGDKSFTKLDASTLFKPNSPVNVLYNPSDPSESYLYAGSISIMHPIASSIIFVIGLVYAFGKSESQKRDELVNQLLAEKATGKKLYY